MEEHYQTHAEETIGKKGSGEAPTTGEYAVPGAPIVRSNTPRPMPFGIVPSKTELPLAPSGTAAASFPTEAPDAPPVPEDPTPTPKSATTTVEEPETPTTSAPPVDITPKTLTSEFLWLFEYALEMDPVLLNRPERLDGSAFAYGPAVLRGYHLIFEGLETRTGHVLASLEAIPDQPESEVWGILYRVPRRLTRQENERASVLDRVHHAETFVPFEIKVRDTYRQREITCLTYVASPGTRQRVSQLADAERIPQPAYLKRLLQTARRQKLPGSYLHTLEELMPTAPAIPLPTTPPEQTTDPIPAVLTSPKLRTRIVDSAGVTLSDQDQAEHDPYEEAEEIVAGPWDARYPAYLERWMMSFALYVCLLLLSTLILATFQGLGIWGGVFTENFAPLGAPWYVLLYGLLGGCISCVRSLSRPRFTYPPAFVVLTWFIRPFLGATLGALAFLILNSGVLALSSQPAQHFALCSLVGALAGYCEGRLLFGKHNKQPATTPETHA